MAPRFRFSPVHTWLLLHLVLMSAFSSCNNPHSSANGEKSPVDQDTATLSKDSTVAAPRRTYREIYEGVVPCADCQGIRTTFRVGEDYQTYELIEEYLGKGVEPRLETGKLNTERGFGQDEDATVYILNFDKPTEEQRYFVRLTNDSTGVKMLDQHQKEIHSDLNYFLRKLSE